MAEAVAWRSKRMTEKVGVRAKASELSFVEGADAANALVKLHAAGFKEPGQLTKIAEVLLEIVMG